VRQMALERLLHQPFAGAAAEAEVGGRLAANWTRR
jgi:hypothetical protein